MEQIEVLIKLPAAKEAKFGKFIKEQRSTFISSPKETAKRARSKKAKILAR